MECNDVITFKQRVFLQMLSDVYNWNKHVETSNSSVMTLGFDGLQERLIRLDTYAKNNYPDCGILYVLLHWAHLGKMKKTPYTIIHLNNLRSHFDEIKTVIKTIDKKIYINGINHLYEDLNYNEYDGYLNPLRTKIDEDFLKRYIEYIKMSVYSK